MVYARLAAIGLLFVTSDFAQVRSGTLNGQVVDDSGFPLPGATITFSGPGGTVTRTSGLNGEYSATLPIGDYRARAALDGFTPVERPVTIREGAMAKRDFKLSPEGIESGTEDSPIVTGIQSAGANRPRFLEQSGIADSSILVGFGRNMGPGTLSVVQQLPLEQVLAGVALRLLAAGQVFPCFPIYVSAGQFAAVVSGNVPPGRAELVVEYQNKTSRPFPVNIARFQPSFFSIRQNGQFEGIFTNPDFSLITKEKPAMPGNPVIAWGTGWGPSQSDTQPVPFDKRSLFSDYGLHAGGEPVPQNDIFYIGSSGGVVGGDQAIFNLPRNTPLGCAVPVYGDVTEADGVHRFSNVVTIPVSSDGSPCGDVHGFSSAEVARLFTQNVLPVGSSAVAELLDDRDGEVVPRLLASFQALNHTPQSYDPLPALGTCKHQWSPAGAGNPFSARALGLSGDYQLRLPSTTIPLRSNSNLGPYANLFMRPANPLADGSYMITYPMIEGATVANKQGQYRRQAGAALDAFQREGNFAPGRNVCLGPVIDAVQRLNMTPDLFVLYDRIYNAGPFGSELVRCALPGSAPALAAAAPSLLRQFSDIDGRLVRNGSRTSPHTEAVSIVVRIIPTGTNSADLSVGPLQVTKETFSAERMVAITDTAAFATCP